MISASVNYKFDVLVQHMNELIVDTKGGTQNKPQMHDCQGRLHQGVVLFLP